MAENAPRHEKGNTLLKQPDISLKVGGDKEMEMPKPKREDQTARVLR